MTLVVSLLCLGVLFIANAPGAFSRSNAAQNERNITDSAKSAERQNMCRTNEFQCNSDLCLHHTQLCDGIKDCEDELDEDPAFCLKETSKSHSVGVKGKHLSKQENQQKYSECGVFDQKPFTSEEGSSRRASWLPWYAIVQSNYHEKFYYTCGGTIISSRAIVSAAACVWNHKLNQTKKPALLKVTVGKYELHTLTSTEQNYTVREVHVPESYGHDTYFANDISILLLTDDIEFNNVVHPICLDFKNLYDHNFVPGKIGIIGSWGGKVTKEGAVLQIHSFPSVSSKECEKANPPNFSSYITPDKFCAGILNDTSLCIGDAGAAFASQFEDGKWYFYGIMILGVSMRMCGNEYYFGFTRIPDHYDFIKKFIFVNEVQNLTISKLNPEFSSVSPPLRDDCTNSFKCLTSGECVNKSLVCNGIRNCEDGSDENHHLCILNNSIENST